MISEHVLTNETKYAETYSHLVILDLRFKQGDTFQCNLPLLANISKEYQQRNGKKCSNCTQQSGLEFQIQYLIRLTKLNTICWKNFIETFSEKYALWKKNSFPLITKGKQMYLGITTLQCRNCHNALWQVPIGNLASSEDRCIRCSRFSLGKRESFTLWKNSNLENLKFTLTSLEIDFVYLQSRKIRSRLHIF